jgi:hypothetical protein
MEIRGTRAIEVPSHVVEILKALYPTADPSRAISLAIAEVQLWRSLYTEYCEEEETLCAVQHQN